MSATDVVLAILAALLSAHVLALIWLAVAVSRLHGRLMRLEEWARLLEKQLNGKK